MFIPHYSVDSYTVAQDLASMYWSGSRAGRPLFIIWYKLCQLYNFNPVHNQWISMMILLMGCVLSHVIIYNAVCKYVCRKMSTGKAGTVFCCLAVIFCNPFIAEWFLYVESSGVYAISLLFTAFGVMFVLRGGVLDCLLGGLCIIIAVMGYQVVVSIFLILSVIFLLMKYDYFPTKKAFMAMTCCAALAAATCICAAACAKWLPVAVGGPARLSEQSIFENIYFVISIQEKYWMNALGLLPDGLVTGILALCLCVILLPCFMKKEWKCIIWLMFVLAGCAAAIFLPYIGSGEHWVTARASVQFFSYIAGLMTIAVLKGQKIIFRFVSVSGICFLAILIYQVNLIVSEQLQTNCQDKAECCEIVSEIEEYENETGITVTKIVYCTDDAVTWNYPGIEYYCAELNMRAMAVDWGIQHLISFYTGKALVSVKTDEKPAAFSNKNWDAFDILQQLYFEEDTVYLCVY